MAPKKASKVTTKSARKEKPVIVFPPMTYSVEDLNTILGLLTCQEYKIKLMALGTLNKYISDENYMHIFLSKGIYWRLCNLLVDEDVFILRFSLKMLTEILTNSEYLNEIDFDDIFACLNPAVQLYLEKEDLFILESSSLIIVQLVKQSEIFAWHIFSLKLIERLFEEMKTTDADVQKNSVELLYYLLQIKLAEEELPETDILSIDILLCLLKSEIKAIKNLTVNIFITLTSWRNKNLLIMLTDKKLNEAMIEMIMNTNDEECHMKAFEVLIPCMYVKECALQFCKTFEFIAFSEWVKFCPTKFLVSSTEILTICTRTPEIRQIMFDLSIEDTIVSLFRYVHEPIYILACEAISNMITYKFCCDKVVTSSLITILLNILKTTMISMSCLEAVVKTLHNFLKRNTTTLRILVKLNCFDLLLTLHETHKNVISDQCVGMILEIILFCCKSKYLNDICDFKLYEMLLHLLGHNQHLLKALNIVDKLVTNEEFRKYFLEMNGPSLLLNRLENSKCPDTFMQVLIVVQNMVSYKNIALAFLDNGCLTLLNSIDPEIRMKVKVIDDVIKLLYDSCLSLKFFYKGRLEITDYLRDSFCLIHDNWFRENDSMKIDGSSVKWRPIYLVNYNLLKQACNSDTSDVTSLSENINESTRQTKGFIEKDIELTCEAIHLKLIHNVLQCMDSKTKQPAISDIETSDDPYLVDYIMELHDQFFTDENDIRSLQERVQFLAAFVDRQMSGFEETKAIERKEHLFQTHLTCLRSKLGLDLIPVGYLRMGYHCERALLFKVLADNLNLPVTLSKGNNGIYWNEVAFLHKDEHMLQVNQFVYYVIDLIDNIGNLMVVGSIEALKYCHLDKSENTSPEQSKEIKLLQKPLIDIIGSIEALKYCHLHNSENTSPEQTKEIKELQPFFDIIENLLH